jgi:hypothetical protein
LTVIAALLTDQAEMARCFATGLIRWFAIYHGPGQLVCYRS